MSTLVGHGAYYPLAGSTSFAAKPYGMDASEVPKFVVRATKKDLKNTLMWRFLEMGVPPNHPFIDGFSLAIHFGISPCPALDRLFIPFFLGVQQSKVVLKNPPG